MQDLSELFSRDPLSLNDADIDQIIAHMREARTQWAKDEDDARKAGKSVRSTVAKEPKKQLTVEEAKALTLDDLL